MCSYPVDSRRLNIASTASSPISLYMVHFPPITDIKPHIIRVDITRLGDFNFVGSSKFFCNNLISLIVPIFHNQRSYARPLRFDISNNFLWGYSWKLSGELRNKPKKFIITHGRIFQLIFINNFTGSVNILSVVPTIVLFIHGTMKSTLPSVVAGIKKPHFFEPNLDGRMR